MNHSKDAILQGLTERIAVQVLRGNRLTTRQERPENHPYVEEREEKVPQGPEPEP